MKIAVCIHLYHIDMWDQIWEYLKNLEFPYKLYVNLSYNTDGKTITDFNWQEYVQSYPDLVKAGKNNHNLAYQHFVKYGIKENRFYKREHFEVQQKILECKPDSKVIISPNKGVDIGGFLFTYKHIEEDVDLILKIHTKKGLGSSESPSLDLAKRGLIKAIKHGNDWFNEMMIGVLGSKDKVKNILDNFEKDQSTGMIGFRTHKNFDLNYGEMKNLFPLFNMGEIPDSSNFVGGTIFWVRNNILKKYLTKDVINEVLERLPYGYVREPSPNHAMERMFGCIVYLENKNIKIIK